MKESRGRKERKNLEEEKGGGETKNSKSGKWKEKRSEKGRV